MKFGTVPIDDALGCVLAHAQDVGSSRIKKGTLLTKAHLEQLKAADFDHVIVAQLEKHDVGENEAAKRIADALMGDHVRSEPPFTGRVNLYATTNGMFGADKALVDALNRIEGGLTLATLPDMTPVQTGRMVATVKIIPYALPENSMRKAEVLIQKARKAALVLHPYKAKRISLLSTILPSLKPSVVSKTRRVFLSRLEASQSYLVNDMEVAHETDMLASTLLDITTPDSGEHNGDVAVIFGASAIIDADDVIPSAIRQAGGTVEAFGMPVDPGNLLLIGELNGTQIIGAPGCARSKAENGFDWVLDRILADIEVDQQDIQEMGVGGLLMEIHSRPQPREALNTSTGSGNIAAYVLAAGQSRRMGSRNKLLTEIDGKPMVRHVVDALVASKVASTHVVVGHEAEQVQSVLAGTSSSFLENHNFEQGMSTSLRTAMLNASAAENSSFDGAMILLGDMPGITTAMIDAMLDAFISGNSEDTDHAHSIVQATDGGKRGNPVIWGRAFYPELIEISGDVGARHLLGKYSDHVTNVELGVAASLDLDTEDELDRYQAI